GRERAERLQAIKQARHADGDAGRRDLLAGEALDQPVIAPAGDNRTEPDRLTPFVGDWRQQVSLEHGPRVILEPPHDGYIQSHLAITISRNLAKLRNRFQLIDAVTGDGICAKMPFEVLDGRLIAFDEETIVASRRTEAMYDTFGFALAGGQVGSIAKQSEI